MEHGTHACCEAVEIAFEGFKPDFSIIFKFTAIHVPIVETHSPIHIPATQVGMGGGKHPEVK